MAAEDGAGWVPVALRVWLDRPAPDGELAVRILKEIAASGPVLGVSVP